MARTSSGEEVTSHFFQTLERHGYKIGKSHQTIYARLAKDKIADYLQISKGQAILGLTQVSYFEDGTAFEYVKVSMSASGSNFIWKITKLANRKNKKIFKCLGDFLSFGIWELF